MPLQREREIGQHRPLQRRKQRRQRNRRGAIEQARSSGGEWDRQQLGTRAARQGPIHDEHEGRIGHRELTRFSERRRDGWHVALRRERLSQPFEQGDISPDQQNSSHQKPSPLIAFHEATQAHAPRPPSYRRLPPSSRANSRQPPRVPPYGALPIDPRAGSRAPRSLPPL